MRAIMSVLQCRSLTLVVESGRPTSCSTETGFVLAERVSVASGDWAPDMGEAAV